MPHNSAPARVLVVIPTLAVGGAEMDLLRVLPRIDPERFAVDVWTYQESGELSDKMVAAGVTVLSPELGAPPLTGSTGRTGAIVRLLRKILLGTRLLQRRRYDVVHAVLPGSYIIAVLASLLAMRGKVAMSRLSQNWYQSDHRLFGWLERNVLHPLVSAAIGNAALIVDELRAEGVAERKLSLIRNGLDIGEFDAGLIDRTAAREQLALPREALVMTAVANLHRYKGYDDLLEALQIAAPRLPQPWLLLVAGSGVAGEMERLRLSAEAAGLGENVRFLGARRDVQRLLSAADIHITASHSEGLPNNVIEAMFAGLPVIGTAVGGIPELIDDGETGCLVASHDPEGLARAIVALAGEPEGRRVMGLAGRRAAEAAFGVERTVAELCAVYEDLSAARRERRPYHSRQAVAQTVTDR